MDSCLNYLNFILWTNCKIMWKIIQEFWQLSTGSSPTRICDKSKNNEDVSYDFLGEGLLLCEDEYLVNLRRSRWVNIYNHVPPYFQYSPFVRKPSRTVLFPNSIRIQCLSSRSCQIFWKICFNWFFKNSDRARIKNKKN